MSRQHQPGDPSLFDLPLGTPVAPPTVVPRRAERTAKPLPAPAAEPGPTLPLFSREQEAVEDRAASRRLRAVPPVPAASAPPAAGLGRRLLAGLGDLALHAAIFVLMLTGARLLGVELVKASLLPTGLALLLFSLLYTVIPLAFWGQTPGMSWAGIVSRSADGEPLSFGQSARQWLGGLLTLALAGLPTLLALSGRSLGDRISGARTLTS